MRLFVLAMTLLGLLAGPACGGSASSPTPTAEARATSPAAATLTPVRAATATATPTVRAASTATQTVRANTTPGPIATSTPVPSGDSGIDGTVTIGPTCPVERVESPCPDRPYEVAIKVFDGRGREVAQARSDSAGRFRLVLSPGTYTLRPPQTGVPPSAAEQTVEVTPGRFTAVHIAFDSGIR